MLAYDRIMTHETLTHESTTSRIRTGEHRTAPGPSWPRHGSCPPGQGVWPAWYGPGCARSFARVAVLMALSAGVPGGRALAQPVRESALRPPNPDFREISPPEGGPFSEMNALLEKTLFKVDVLTLQVRVSEETAAELAGLVRGRQYSNELADSVAVLVLRERDAWARIEFLRSVSLNQLVDGIRDNMKKAVEAGLLEEEDFTTITAAMPVWFGFLEVEGASRGDEILYRIRGDSLRTVYRTAGEEVLLDQVDVGAERRMAVLGSYFAPGSDFRKRLIRSLFRQDREDG